MKRNIINYALALVFVGALALGSFGQSGSKPLSPDCPSLADPTGPVMDYAGVLDVETIGRIEKQINEFRDNSNPSTELAVAIVKSTGDRPIFDYSLALARCWEIGSGENDNPGALLFIAIDDRKYFTQVSLDLEDELTDEMVGMLQKKYLVPEFKAGNYGKGIENTIDSYIRTIKASRNGESDSTAPPSGNVDPKRDEP